MGKFCVSVTDDQLRAAYERRRRDSWPSTFEAAYADQWYRRLISVEAYCHVRRLEALAAYNQRRDTMRAQARAQGACHGRSSATPSAPTKTPRGQAQLSLLPSMDHKRRASGERDDD